MPIPVVFNTDFNQVTLCNMALSKLGDRSTIGSISENSAEGSACTLWYKMSMAQTLGAFNWGFARARLALVTSASDAPTNEWQYRYNYPSNCFKIRYIENPAGPDADAIPYTVEYSPNATKSILTDLEDATIVYTIDISDVQFIDMYTPEFINAFTSVLAGNMAFTITGDKNFAQAKKQEAIFDLRIAAGFDGNETIEKKPRDAESIRGRA